MNGSEPSTVGAPVAAPEPATARCGGVSLAESAENVSSSSKTIFMVLSRERLLSAVQVRIYDSLPGTTGEERMTALRSYLPGAWDLLYLGGSHQTQPLSRLNAHVVRNYGMTRAHAYGISWQAAERITRELDGKHGVGSEDDPRVTVGVPGHILVPYAKNPDVFSHTVTPRLFIQRPTSQSDRVSTPPRLESDQIDAQRETASLEWW